MNGEPGAALGEELARRIKDAVDAGFDDQIAFLQDLVRRPRCAARSIWPRT